MKRRKRLSKDPLRITHTFLVTCYKNIHKILLTSKGKLVVCKHSSQDLASEDIAEALGAEPAACAKFLKAWRLHADSNKPVQDEIRANQYKSLGDVDFARTIRMETDPQAYRIWRRVKKRQKPYPHYRTPETTEQAARLIINILGWYGLVADGPVTSRHPSINCINDLGLFTSLTIYKAASNGMSRIRGVCGAFRRSVKNLPIPFMVDMLAVRYYSELLRRKRQTIESRKRTEEEERNRKYTEQRLRLGVNAGEVTLVMQNQQTYGSDIVPGTIARWFDKLTIYLNRREQKLVEFYRRK